MRLTRLLSLAFKDHTKFVRIIFSFLFVFLFFMRLETLQAQKKADPEKTVITVKKGDSLYAIGRRYGVSVKELSAANHITNPNRLRIGQALVIPQKSFAPSSVPSAPSAVQPRSSSPPPKTFLEPDLVEAEPILIQEKPEVAPVHPVQSSSPTRASPIASSAKERRGREFFGVGFGWWFAFLDAKAQISIPGIAGTSIDLVNDLGVDDTVGIPVVSFWVQPLSWLRFQGEYMTAGIEGSKSIDESLVFDGRTFSISDTVRGNLDIQRFSGWVEINPFNGSWGYLGGSIGGEFVELEGSLSDDLIGSVSSSLDAGTLTLGGQVGINLTDQLSAHARIRGMSFEISDVGVDVFDIQAGLSYTLWDHLELSADYRYLFLKVKEDENSGEVKLQGPMLSGRIKF